MVHKIAHVAVHAFPSRPSSFAAFSDKKKGMQWEKEFNLTLIWCGQINAEIARQQSVCILGAF